RIQSFPRGIARFHRTEFIPMPGRSTDSNAGISSCSLSNILFRREPDQDDVCIGEYRFRVDFFSWRRNRAAAINLLHARRAGDARSRESSACPPGRRTEFRSQGDPGQFPKRKFPWVRRGIDLMSLIGDLVDGVLEGTGWAAGVAVVLGVAAIGTRRDSPVVKEVMKGYVTVADRVKELMAEAGEQLADLY